MGIFGKLTKKMAPKKSSILSRADTFLKKKEPSDVEAKGGPAPAAGSDDDEATVFTTFMIIYYGFFAITCIAYPEVHMVGGLPFDNPLAYWTTITPALEFALRGMGCAFFVLIMGPFLDEIFGGAGVSMMAFTRQMCLLNALFTLMFLYYGYYAPPAAAVVFMFQIQAGVSAFLLGWSILEVSGSWLTDYYSAFTSLYFGFFAVGLSTVPDLLFGPASPLTYWKEWEPLDLMIARCVGYSMAAMFLLGYLYFGKTDGYAKMCTAWNVAIFGLCVIPAYFGGASAVAKMWEIQFLAQIPIVIVGLLLVLGGATGPWKCAFKPPAACGFNAETFCFFNLFWFLGFAIPFIVDPNFVFGVSSPIMPAGLTMFLVDVGETGLWFSKVWAVLVMILACGPYLFETSYVKTAKQFTLLYVGFAGMFAYVLLTEEIANPIQIIPLACVNVLLFVWGLVAVLPANSGEAML